MQPHNLIWLLRVAIRLLETWLQRRTPTKHEPTRADKVMERVAPLAEKVLERVAPNTTGESTRPASATPTGAEPPTASGRRSAGGAVLQAALFSAVVSGGVAYLVIQQQRRWRERHRFLQAVFPEELLEVLALPGGGGRLVYSGASLIDPDTGAVFPVVDGIPDFMAVEGETERPAPGTLPWQELIEPAQRQALGYNVAGSAALAGAAALAAGSGWALCAPCGSGGEVIEMARANPEARFLCIDPQWERVLETRRLARHAELKNVYFARGDVTLLPVRGGTMSAAWSQARLLSVAPERFTTQLARVTKPEAWVAGLARLSGEQADYLAVLAASGLRDVRSFRDGAFVRWMGVRA